jgi:4-hydroxybenzoyl-CoA thioesterase
MKPSVIEIEIDWADCDPAGIVFYPQFFRMMNIGTQKLFEHVGLPFHVLVQRYGTSGVPMLDVQATFKSPARFGDKVLLESEVTEWRDKTFLVRHVMKLGERVIFEGREIRVWAAKDESAPNGIRAKPIPADLKALFGA